MVWQGCNLLRRIPKQQTGLRTIVEPEAGCLWLGLTIGQKKAGCRSGSQPHSTYGRMRLTPRIPQILLLLYILQTVKGYSRDDDDTFKYKLKVCINTKNCKGINQYGKYQHTDYHA